MKVFWLDLDAKYQCQGFFPASACKRKLEFWKEQQNKELAIANLCFQQQGWAHGFSWSAFLMGKIRDSGVLWLDGTSSLWALRKSFNPSPLKHNSLSFIKLLIVLKVSCLLLISENSLWKVKITALKCKWIIDFTSCSQVLELGYWSLFLAWTRKLREHKASLAQSLAFLPVQ